MQYKNMQTIGKTSKYMKNMSLFKKVYTTFY